MISQHENIEAANLKFENKTLITYRGRNQIGCTNSFEKGAIYQEGSHFPKNCKNIELLEKFENGKFALICIYEL